MDLKNITINLGGRGGQTPDAPGEVGYSWDGRSPLPADRIIAHEPECPSFTDVARRGYLEGLARQAGPKLCLTMIVKNEAHIIERCLESASNFISYYCICDTGSTDKTPEIIKKYFDALGIPGTIPRFPFENFGQARTRMLIEARKISGYDYHLFCDADMTIEVTDLSFYQRLQDSLAHKIKVSNPSLEYRNVFLLHRDAPASYIGTTHEYLDLGSATSSHLDGIYLIDHTDGGNRSEKFSRDLQLLDAGLQTEPNNVRYHFYRAQTLFDLGRLTEAVTAYSTRIKLGGWIEEIYYSKYRLGQSLLRLGRSGDGIETLLGAWQHLPTRSEALHVIANHYLRCEQYQLSHLFSTAGLEIKQPNDGLFLEPDVYLWRLLDIKAVSLFYLGGKDEARKINEYLLSVVPDSQKERICRNLEFCR